MPELPALRPIRLTGQERFQIGEEKLPFSVYGFWQWVMSDLVSNTARGVLAEYIVARALNIVDEGARQEWVAYDLLTPDGIKVEVKSSAYLQTWKQKDYSKPSFSIAPAKGWDPEEEVERERVERYADVYVFALLAHKDKLTVDPLDIEQWVFYVLPTRVLNNYSPEGKTIALSTVEALAGPPVPFHLLAAKVKEIGV